MDLEHSLAADNTDTKTSFPKPSNEAANRKYRHRSPLSGSSSPDGSPKKEHRSPRLSKVSDTRVTGYQQGRRDGGRESDRDSDRNQYRGGESHRYSRNSHNYNRRDDYTRHDRYGNEDERNIQRSSHRSGRDSRGGTYPDHGQPEDEHNRSRDNRRNTDRSYHDKHDDAGHIINDHSSLEHQKYKDKGLSARNGASRKHSDSNVDFHRHRERDRNIRDGDSRDDRRNYNRNSRDYRSNHISSREDSRGHSGDLSFARESTEQEARKSHCRDSDDEHARGAKILYDDGVSSSDKDQYDRGAKQSENRAATVRLGEPTAKKPKHFSFDSVANNGDAGSGGEKQSLCGKQISEDCGKMMSESDSTNNAGAHDLNAAKFAAIKAAELVNKNLTGVGCMSTEQKKKLLWGNKKNASVEESAHRWDATMFPDRERQEKFNKLMGVKGDLKVEHHPNSQGTGDVEKQKELQQDLEKQYTAGLRRRDGRTVGLGL